jgi:hypothetical protein
MPQNISECKHISDMIWLIPQLCETGGPTSDKKHLYDSVNSVLLSLYRIQLFRFQILHITSCFLSINIFIIKDGWNELPHKVHGSMINTEDFYLQEQVCKIICFVYFSVQHGSIRWCNMVVEQTVFHSPTKILSVAPQKSLSWRKDRHPLCLL